MRRHAAVIATVALLLFAGCVGGESGITTTTSQPDATSDAETTTGTTVKQAESSDGPTAMNFYVSDEENAMGDFAHLNVTVSEVGLKPAGEDDAGWESYEVDDRTVDLTRLVGPNATRLGTFEVGNGTYESTFVYVSEVNGTLKNGETVRVKLPSEKLQIHQTFTVGANETVDYVFDISVFEAGKSGKYVLKPVIGESGTDVPVESVDEEPGDGYEHEHDRDHTALNATFVGNVTPGENATVAVTRNGSAVANATVEVGGEPVGRIGADGTVTFRVPDDEDLEVEIETENESTELKREFESDDGNDAERDEEQRETTTAS